MMSMGMEGTKWQIFNAAIDMFADSSYHSVSMRDIARRVGIKASSIYNHFLSKEELLTTIFDYYLHYLNHYVPDLGKLLDRADNDAPFEVLHDAVATYDESIQKRMDRIVIIACKEMHNVPIAEHLLYDSLIRVPTDIVGALLDRMIECGSLEPVDRDTFLLLFTSLHHTCALRQHTAHPVSLDEWQRGIEMLYTLLRPAGRFGAAVSSS